jgi:hypothetical protein
MGLRGHRFIPRLDPVAGNSTILDDLGGANRSKRLRMSLSCAAIDWRSPITSAGFRRFLRIIQREYQKPVNIAMSCCRFGALPEV